MSVSDAHVLTDAVEADLRNQVDGAVVTIHVDPDEPGNREHEEMAAEAAGLHLHRH